jgi:hypothetical protein
MTTTTPPTTPDGAINASAVEGALADMQPEEPVTFKKVLYFELNSRQQEILKFQKVSADLADYGYNCLSLSDNQQGADFIAYHIDGNRFERAECTKLMTAATRRQGHKLPTKTNSVFQVRSPESGSPSGCCERRVCRLNRSNDFKARRSTTAV